MTPRDAATSSAGLILLAFLIVGAVCIVGIAALLLSWIAGVLATVNAGLAGVA